MYTGLSNLGLSGYHSQYSELKEQAIAAARRNNASLWFAGAPADLAGFTFQDSTGITPATGTDPIGLLLDRQYGAANRGGELIVNGSNLTTTTGWTANVATLTASAGQLVMTTTGTGDNGAFQDITTIVGATYVISAAMVNNSATAAMRIRVATSGFALITESQELAAGQSGVRSAIFQATTTTTRIVFDRRASFAVAGDVIRAGNISLRQVLGIPALQATAANKPTLELQANGFFGMRFDGTDDFLATQLISPAAGYTSIRSLSFQDYSDYSGGFFDGSNGQYFTASASLYICNDNASPTAGLSVAAVNALNTPTVFSADMRNGAQRIWQNGTLRGSSSATVAPSTSGNAKYAFACAGTTLPVGYSAMTLMLDCVGSSNMPDADRIAIERFAALLSGATYA